MSVQLMMHVLDIRDCLDGEKFLQVTSSNLKHSEQSISLLFFFRLLRAFHILSTLSLSFTPTTFSSFFIYL